MDVLRIWVIGASEICYLGVCHALSMVYEVSDITQLSADSAVGSLRGSTSGDVCILCSCQLHHELVPLCMHIHAEAPELPILIWSSGKHLDAGDVFGAGASGYVSSCSVTELSRAVEALRQGYQYCDTVNSQIDYHPSETCSGTPKLTPRQEQIQLLAGLGWSDKEIAADLGISPHTVRSHLRAIFEISGVRRRSGLMMHRKPWRAEDRMFLSC